MHATDPLHKTENPASAHTFHIPVMGTGFTVDAPLRVARFGISSVISLVDDVLIEQMRRFHCAASEEPCAPIETREEDARARRITAYLDLVDRLVRRQAEALRAAPFEAGSELTRYFELLPEGALKQAYRKMRAAAAPDERRELQEALRARAVPGSIDVNIMTKLDRDTYHAGVKLPPEFSDALAALRGYALSTLRSTIVFSAGLNQRLFAYMARFGDFFPDAAGAIRKKITLKVSDYRSAEVQSRFLAKRGLWVSEYRIESGLNCGGHAFATKGLLLGPILEEFKARRDELRARLFATCAPLWQERAAPAPAAPPPVRLTVQGGIGTAAEDRLLYEVYGVDGTGWATPFLLVPEVTRVDDALRRKLAAATEEDVYLSSSSPLGIPYWNLRTCASEEERRKRIRAGRPGSPCPKGFLVANTEFTAVPICTASHGYQERKLRALRAEALPAERLAALEERVMNRSCICHDLGGGAALYTGADADATPAVCPGPNIANFSKIATLEEMVGHIYGRLSLLSNPRRAHMFLNELTINIAFLRAEAERCAEGLSTSAPSYFQEFRENLLAGIAYYQDLAGRLGEAQRTAFLAGLAERREQLAALGLPASAVSV